MSYLTQQLRKTCTTHTQTQDWTIHFDSNLPLCFSLQSQPIPHKHTLQLHWPLHTQSPKRSTTKSSCSVPTLQNPLQETFVPPPWQPPTVIDHHKTTHDQVFWRLHLSFNFLLSKGNSVHFFFCSVYQRITTNYFVIFLDWSWRLEWDLLKNHYKHLCVFLRVSWRASC